LVCLDNVISYLREIIVENKEYDLDIFIPMNEKNLIFVFDNQNVFIRRTSDG